MKSLNTLIKSLVEKKQLILIYSLITLPVLIVFIITSASFYTSSISYDESYNLQVSKNLAESGRYATNGSVFDGDLKDFDPYISTGSTLLIPIAVMFKVFGVDVWQFRAVMNIVYLAFCVFTAWFVMKATRSKKITNVEKYLFGLFAITISVAFLGNSLMGEKEFFFAVAQGEPLALTLTILSMLLLQYGKKKSAALVIGLAILTKLVFIFLVPFFLVGVFIEHKSSILGKFRHALSMAAVIAIPTLLFELYKFASLGFNTTSYVTNTKEFVSFFLVGGGDPTAAITPLSMVKERTLSIASIDLSLFNTTSIIVILLGIFVLHSLTRTVLRSVRIKFNKRAFSRLNIPSIYIFGSIVLWLLWWVFISSRPWTRYAVAPIAMAIIASVALLHIQVSLSRKTLCYVLLGFICLLSVFTLSTNRIKNDLDVQRAEVARISEIYESKEIYTFGWWQNPEAQFISGRASKPYQMGADIPTAWVLTSKLHRNLDTTGYLRDTTLCDEMIELEYYGVCKITK